MTWVLQYQKLKLLQCLLAFYVGFLTYANIGPPGGLRDQETGLIVDQASSERKARGLILVNGSERPIVAATFFQVCCIGITRCSAFFMYPGKSSVQHFETLKILAAYPLTKYCPPKLHSRHQHLFLSTFQNCEQAGSFE